nr:Fel d 1 CH2 [synthetic construct]
MRGALLVAGIAGDPSAGRQDGGNLPHFL